MFAEAFRVRASVTAVWLRNWSPPKRAGGAGGAPVEPGRPVPVEQHRGRLRQRAQSLDDSPPGVGAGAGPSRSSAFYVSGNDALDAADGDALAVTPDVEGAIGAEHKHTQSGQGKKGRRA